MAPFPTYVLPRKKLDMFEARLRESSRLAFRVAYGQDAPDALPARGIDQGVE